MEKVIRFRGRGVVAEGPASPIVKKDPRMAFRAGVIEIIKVKPVGP